MLPDYIASPKGSPDSLLYFIIYLEKNLRSPFNPALSTHYMLYLLNQAAWHVSFLRRLYGKELPVYRQVARKGLRKLITKGLGFTPTEFKSADGYIVYKLTSPTTSQILNDDSTLTVKQAG